MEGAALFEGGGSRMVRLTTRGHQAASPSLHWGPVLFYDERCSVCRRFVTMAVRADRRGLLRIAALQGRRAEAIRHLHPEFRAMDSALWVPSDGTPVGHSDAILSLLAYLGGPWRLLASAGRLVPRSLRNWGYRILASNRHFFSWLGLPELDAQSRGRLLHDEWHGGRKSAQSSFSAQRPPQRSPVRLGHST